MSFREDTVLRTGHSNDCFAPADHRSGGLTLDSVGPLLAFVTPLLESVRPLLHFVSPLLAIVQPLFVSGGGHVWSGRPPGYSVVSHACCNGSLRCSNGSFLASVADTIPAERPRVRSV